jgi:GTP-binding protein Era
MVGQKIASVSARPQTTRRRQLGIITSESAQLIFVDTPGLHQPRHKLGEFMNKEVKESLEHCDLILFLVDASQEPQEGDYLTANPLLTIELWV